MSDVPDRTLQAPPPRKRPSGSALIAANRPRPADGNADAGAIFTAPDLFPLLPEADRIAPAPVSPEREVAPAPAASVQPEPEPAGPMPAQTIVPSAPAQLQATAPRPQTRQKVSALVPIDLRERIRAAFKATKDAEGEETFNEMMVALLERECERRERIYNGGQRFPGGDRQLPRGRPFA